MFIVIQALFGSETTLTCVFCHTTIKTLKNMFNFKVNSKYLYNQCLYLSEIHILHVF